MHTHAHSQKTSRRLFMWRYPSSTGSLEHKRMGRSNLKVCAWEPVGNWLRMLHVLYAYTVLNVLTSNVIKFHVTWPIAIVVRVTYFYGCTLFLNLHRCTPTTVEPPITGPPTSGQPLYNGHWLWHQLKLLFDSGQQTSCMLLTDQLCTTVPLIPDKQETTPIFHAGI